MYKCIIFQAQKSKFKQPRKGLNSGKYYQQALLHSYIVLWSFFLKADDQNLFLKNF